VTAVPDLAQLAINTIRTLSIDAVQKAQSGHPGLPLGAAPMAYALWQRHLAFDAVDPSWPDRDRFVLSAGHGSMLLYSLLHLYGFDVSLDDLKAFRQWKSKTPGHPESFETPGVEATTGPLGQGTANAVGMAIAERFLARLFNQPGHTVVDHYTYALVSDGDVMEGVAYEAASLAGHLGLGKLIYLYDANDVTLDGPASLILSEDVGARYAACGWQVLRVDDGDHDVAALDRAIAQAKADTARPSLIIVRTTIGYGSPKKAGTSAAHGAPLGADEVAATKKILGFDPDTTFAVAEDVLARAREVVERGRVRHAEWQQQFDRWAAENPQRHALFTRLAARALPDGWTTALPEFPPNPKGVSTRKASGEVINAIAPLLPELWGGSADLAESNNTTVEGEPSFVPPEFSTKVFPGDWYGRTLHFGIREHGMGTILNGIVLHGGTRPYGGTFLVFSDYMRPAVRLAALMGLPVIYVWTHDSIGLGEDGPTHQPVEHLSALRAIPGLDVVRPADANETVVAWRLALEHTDRPTALCLTRQNLPVFDRTEVAPVDGVAKGGYVLADASDGQPRVILIGTGSEVSVCLEARERLEAEGVPTRVVSMVCQEWFRAQDPAYRQGVLPPNVTARVSVEAAIAMSWHDLVGDAGECVSLEHYGASAPYQVLFEQFGFTPDRVVAAARASLSRAGAVKGSTTGN